MRHAQVKRTRRAWSTNKKVILAVALGVLALVGVFGVLSLTRERLNYAEAHEYATGMLATKGEFEGIFDAKVASLELSENEKKVMTDFETAAEKCKNYMTSLGASNVLKDEKVAEKYEAVRSSYGSIEKTAAIWADVKLLMDLTDENIEKLSQSQSAALKALSEELKGYRAEVKEFKKKYGDVKGQASNEMIEAYGKVQLIGDDLNKKYEKVSLEEIVGMSRDDILRFYATIEELDKILSEKM